jgi:hypothetical protein
MPQNSYTEDMTEYELYDYSIKVVDSMDSPIQYESTLRYVELYYKKTENFVLYNSLLRRLNNKKPLLD